MITARIYSFASFPCYDTFFSYFTFYCSQLPKQSRMSVTSWIAFCDKIEEVLKLNPYSKGNLLAIRNSMAVIGACMMGLSMLLCNDPILHDILFYLGKSFIEGGVLFAHVKFLNWVLHLRKVCDETSAINHGISFKHNFERKPKWYHVRRFIEGA